MITSRLLWAVVIGVVFGAIGFAAAAGLQGQSSEIDRLTPMPSKASIAPKYVLGIHGTITPEGVLVTKVLPGTVAEEFGLRPGDWILAVNRAPIDSCDAWALAINESEGEALLLVRYGQTGALMQLEAQLPRAVLPLVDPPLPVKPRPRP